MVNLQKKPLRILDTKSEVLDNAPMGTVTNPETLPMHTEYNITINKGKGSFSVDMVSRVPYVSGGVHIFTVSVKIHFESMGEEDILFEDFRQLMDIAIGERNGLISIRNGASNPPLQMIPLTESELTQLYLKQLAYDLH